MSKATIKENHYFWEEGYLDFPKSTDVEPFKQVNYGSRKKSNNRKDFKTCKVQALSNNTFFGGWGERGVKTVIWQKTAMHNC